jgi:hypothetical protein
MSSYAVWWIEIVVVLAGTMCLAVLIREAAAFVKVRRIRQRDGGIPVPRTREEYLLLFPQACPRCLSRDGKRVRGWYHDRYGTPAFVDRWQCGECGYVGGGNHLSPMREADITERRVKARQRWFIRAREAEHIRRAPPGG